MSGSFPFFFEGFFQAQHAMQFVAPVAAGGFARNRQVARLGELANLVRGESRSLEA